MVRNKSSYKKEVKLGIQGGLLNNELVLEAGRVKVGEEERYNIGTRSVNGGSITVSQSSGITGQTINIVTNPSTSYSYYGATIRDDSGNVLQTLDANTKTFTMPSQAVVVSPKWKYNNMTIFNLNTSDTLGSWVRGKWNNTAIQYTFYSDYIAFNFPTADFSVIEFFNERGFDLTQYDVLNVCGYGTGTNTNGYYLMAGITNDINMQTWVWENNAASVFVPKDNYACVNLNISTFTGAYYLGIALQNNYQSSYGFISQVELVGHVYE